jgi:hypothetical protein
LYACVTTTKADKATTAAWTIIVLTSLARCYNL